MEPRHPPYALIYFLFVDLFSLQVEIYTNNALASPADSVHDVNVRSVSF